MMYLLYNYDICIMCLINEYNIHMSRFARKNVEYCQKLRVRYMIIYQYCDVVGSL